MNVGEVMQDNIGRVIDYLRISVTDKCNLRCKYCIPPEGVERIPHRELLTLEELARVINIMAGLGVRNVRFTGGEPLVRKNLEKLIADVSVLEGVESIALTTNGVLLRERLAALLEAGVTAINISLDTLDEQMYREITGTDACKRVLEAIGQSVAAGIPTKVNCVPCREWNETELADVAGLARSLPVDVRFIELMPMGCGRRFHGIPSQEVLERLQAVYGGARPLPESAKRGNGPARYYEFEDFKGKIGFISPMSHKFCGECNRIRLTAEGRLKLCLHYDMGIDLKPLLREGGTDEEIRNAIVDAVRRKPVSHDFEHELTEHAAGADSRRMVQIGG